MASREASPVAHRDDGRLGHHHRPALPFLVERFAVVATASKHALLRLEGRWSIPPAARPSRTMLIALFGSGRVAVAPLPGSSDVRSAALWRAGFAVPHDVLGPRTAFVLDGGRAGALRLPPPAHEEDARRTGAPRRKILIVGHSPFERAMLRRFFEQSCCDVAEVDTGEAAVLEMAYGGRIDAVLVGDQLPDGPGLALVRWIRTAPGHECHNVPVLVLAADDSAELKVRAYDAGADMVVAKPIDLDVLDRKLQAITRSAARGSRSLDVAGRH